MEAVTIKSPDTFTEEEVWQFLKALDLSDHIESFRHNAVDGPLLVTLTFDDLTEEIGVSMGEAEKVLRMVNFGRDLVGGLTSNDPRVQSLEAENEGLRMEIADLEKEIRYLKGEPSWDSNVTYSGPATAASNPATLAPADAPTPISLSSPSYVTPTTPSPSSYVGAQYVTSKGYITDTSTAVSATQSATPYNIQTQQPSYVSSIPTTTTQIPATAGTIPSYPTVPSAAAPAYTPYVTAETPRTLASRAPRNVYVPQTSSAAPYVPATANAYVPSSASTTTSNYRAYQPKVYVPYQPNAANNAELPNGLARYV